MRPLKVLAVHPGASWSTVDVLHGLSYGLQSHGVQVVHYRLDLRIESAHRSLHVLWRVKKRDQRGLPVSEQREIPKPTQADAFYQAGVGALEMALREKVDVVLIVSAMYLHPDVIVMMKRAGLKVVVLFTESPYDIDHELKIAALVDGCWTNERTCVPALRQVNPNSGYLPHAWHPLKHYASVNAIDAPEIPSHDVVFVGTGFPDRITFFNAINWDGIDLGLYGTWKDFGLKPQVDACIKGEQVGNEYASALYRKAKIGLNLYRKWKGFGLQRERVYGESLSPRNYELAACGSFSISDFRSEVPEVFGDLVPTFETPTEAAGLIRMWLADEQGRARVAASLPACVAEASWTERAKTVIGDLERLLQARAA